MTGWLEYRGPDFTIRTDAGTDALEQLVGDLSVFVEVVRRTMQIESVRPKLPTTIWVYRDMHSFAHVQLNENAGGQFHGTREGNFIHFPLGNQPTRRRRILYHEFVHYVVRNLDQHYPTWYNEGIAEMLSTVHSQGGVITIGLKPSRLAEVPEGEWIPVADLLAIGTTLDMPAEYGRQFYAESWALVHFLHTHRRPGGNTRIREMLEYLRLVSRGSDPERAVEVAFQLSVGELDEKLREYWAELLTGRISFFDLDASTLKTSGDVPPLLTPIPPTEIASAVARMALLYTPPRIGLAQKMLDAALTIDPEHAKALVLLSYMRAVTEEEGEIAEPLLRAVARAPDDPMVRLYAGRTLEIQARRGSSLDLEQLDAARAHLTKACELAPHVPAAFAELGFSYLDGGGEGGDLRKGITALEAVMRMRREDSNIRFGLASLLMEAGEANAARKHLALVTAWEGESELGKSAKLLLEQLDAASGAKGPGPTVEGDQKTSRDLAPERAGEIPRRAP